MPRQKNTKPTSIYWLWDTRPEMIAKRGPLGEPFYCGKTVAIPERRLQGHRQKPNGDAGPRILECGEHIRIQVIEVVSAEQDWASREKFGIYTMRLFWPGCCLNKTDGGEGVPGWVPDAENIAKRRERRHSSEVRNKIGAAFRGRHQSPDHVAKRVAIHLGRKHSPESREKISAAKCGKKLSPEHRAKIGAFFKGKSGKLHTAESRAKISAAKRNPSAETRAKLSAAQLGKKLSSEHIAKMREGHRRYYHDLSEVA